MVFRELTRGKIVAVVDKLSFDRYLHHAGAEYVLSPKHITGRILARHAELTAHHPGALDTSGIDHAILDSSGSYDSVLKVVHIPVMPGSRSAGKTLKEIGLYEKYGFYTLFMARSGKFVFHPGDDEVIDLSSGVFLLGRADRVKETGRERIYFRAFRREFCRHCRVWGCGEVGIPRYDRSGCFLCCY